LPEVTGSADKAMPRILEEQMQQQNLSHDLAYKTKGL
jgi:hypothetical protein